MVGIWQKNLDYDRSRYAFLISFQQTVYVICSGYGSEMRIVVGKIKKMCSSSKKAIFFHFGLSYYLSI